MHKFLLCHFKGEHKGFVPIPTCRLRNLHSNSCLSYTRSCSKNDKVSAIESAIGIVVKCLDMRGNPCGVPFGKFICKVIGYAYRGVPDLVPDAVHYPISKTAESIPDSIGRCSVGNLSQGIDRFVVCHSLDVGIKE